jgi:hypothetical protein
VTSTQNEADCVITGSVFSSHVNVEGCDNSVPSKQKALSSNPSAAKKKEKKKGKRSPYADVGINKIACSWNYHIVKIFPFSRSIIHFLNLMFKVSI